MAALAAGTDGFFREIRHCDVTSIRKYLDSCSLPFEESEVYVVAEERNVVDPSKRCSRFRRITDPTLFELLEPLVARLSEEDPALSYMQVRNDVTQICYGKGGFFGRHQDYLSVTSNLLEEFALLLCVTPQERAEGVRGGRTVVHLHQQAHESDATTTPGCALVFRKDLEHESELLEEGEKQVLMVNLWASRKGASGAALLVTFGEEEAGGSVSESTGSAASARSYAIPVAEAMRSPRLAECIERAGPQQAPRYTCRDCSFEAFGTVFRILRRMRVSSEEVEAHQAVIRSYGLELQAVVTEPETGRPAMGHHEVTVHLMDGSSHSFSTVPSDLVLSLRRQLQERTGKEGLRLITQAGEMLPEEASLQACGLPTSLTAVKRRLKADEYPLLQLTAAETVDLAPAAAEGCGGDVVLCESAARAKVVAAAALAAGLPYVFFEAIFIEGQLKVSGDTCRPGKYEMGMVPVVLTAGDRRQVFGAWRYRWWEDEAREQRARQSERLFDLSRALKGGVESMDLVRSTICNADHGSEDEAAAAGSAGTLQLTQPVTEGDGEEPAGLFHVDSEGKTCFGRAEAKEAVKLLQEMSFAEQVTRRVGSVPFQLPQSSQAKSHTFCNERVYGNLNVLLLSGVVRLER